MSLNHCNTSIKSIFALFIALLLVIGLNTTTTHAEPNKDLANITLIYDLSNSMWAQINGAPKVSLAQNGIAKGLAGLNNKINFGLLAFGHNAKSGCKNVEEISPLTVLDESKINIAIKPLRPRGNAPTGQALLNAANMIADRSKPYTIIILTDGQSNCPIDPCQTASKLKNSIGRLTIDVIAIGQKGSQTLKPLNCISQPSKGTFTYANSQKEISAAITASIERARKNLTSYVTQTKLSSSESDIENQAVADKAESDKKEQTTQKQTDWAGATEIIVAPKPKEVTGTLEEDKFANKNKDEKDRKKTHGGLALMAHLVDKKDTAIKSGLIWRIYSEKPDKTTGKHKLISAHKTASPVMSLQKGSYLINAAYGRAFLTRKIKIEASKNTTEHFILNAGGLKISSVLANGNPVPENTVIFDILSDERDQYGKRLKVIGNVRPGLVVRLNAGIYHIVSTYGDANAQSRADISVEAGKLTEATIDHKAAKVTFKLVYQKGGEALADTQWSLLSPTGKLIKKTAGALPTHYLAAGDYTLLAERGDKKYSQHFSITAGDTKQIEVIIQ